MIGLLWLRRLRNGIIWLAWLPFYAYCAGVVIFLILRLLTGTRLWPVAMAAALTPWLLLPALAILPLALWRRKRALILLSGAGALTFAALYGELFLPRPPASEAPTLRVMSYNVNGSFTEPGQLLEALDRADADIVGLVEVAEAQAKALEGSGYPYHYTYYEALHATSGLALLSRYPLLDTAVFLLDTEQRPHLRAILDIDGQPLTVLVAHPPSPGISRRGFRPHPEMMAEIGNLAALASAGGPALLLGDLNITDQSDEYALLTRAGLIDSFRAAGWSFGLTWPARRIIGWPDFPLLVRSDYIWHTADLSTVAAWVGPEAGSDHLPVLADLHFSPPDMTVDG